MRRLNANFNWLLILPLIAFLGNVIYAAGAPGGWIKFYSPALVASSLIAFVWLHGTQCYGKRALGRFVLIVFSVAWIAETVSMFTGVPFGNYHYTEIMAPYLWHVPVFVLPAYALMGYISWSMAVLILCSHRAKMSFADCISVPLLAAVHMVVWDLSMDPLRATLEQRWIWLDGGAYYGIPISNFFGWFVVTWIMFQLFACYLWNGNAKMPRPVLPRGGWTSIPMAYLAFSGEYLFNPLFSLGHSTLVYINGTVHSVQQIYTDIALICGITMVPLAVFGMRKALAIGNPKPEATTSHNRSASQEIENAAQS